MPTRKGASELNPQPKRVPVGRLFLDPRNPRLAELGTAQDASQEEILDSLWRNMAVDEIAYSIAKSGYFNHEPLFVSQEEGELRVIEGNRRLAAVKVLLDAGLRRRLNATDLPKASAKVREEIASLPVIQCKRADIWNYVGFKHVNGPQQWGPYSKAHYVATVHNEFKTPLKDIADTIGDRHSTVKRLYRGMMALAQAEAAGVFHRSDRSSTRFAFSHLYTGLDYTGFQRFLGFKPEQSFKPNFVPKAKVEKLGELCVWLYGSRSTSTRPVIRSQNPDLKNLDKVLMSENGVAALRQGLPLETSLDISRGDEDLFREALVGAKEALQSARGKVLHGYKGDLGLLEAAGEAKDLIVSLLDDMERIRERPRKLGPKERPRR